MRGLDTKRSSLSSIDPSAPEEGSPSPTPPRAPKEFNRPFSQHVYKEPAQNLRYSQPEFVASGIASYSKKTEISQIIQAAPKTENPQPKELDGSRHPRSYGSHQRDEFQSRSHAQQSRGWRLDSAALSLGYQIRSKSQNQPFTAWKYRDPMYIHPYLGTPSSILQTSPVDRGQRCAMTVNNIVTRALFEILKYQELSSMPLEGGLQVQILKSVKGLPGCQLHHFAAFIEDKQILVVWDDDPKAIFDRAKRLEKKAMALVWPSEQRRSVDSMAAGHDSEGHRTKDVGDHIIFLAIAPINLFISLFFFYSLVSNFFLMLGSSESVKSNSKYYSGERPRSSALAWKGRHLPHVTIQMPVYREGLSGVIKPTVLSLKTAISTYEMQGGTASIFINDDGMQLLSESKAQERRDFYDEHNIGWVARPKHNPPGSSRPSSSIFKQLQRPLKDSEETIIDAQCDGIRPGSPYFIRRGKFKKASNMNHALHISNCVDKKLASVDRSQEIWGWASENVAYNRCLAETLAEDPHGTWASGNIRMGDYILVVDSDTRVPTDFLLDGVTEMDQSPDVAILQYTSGVLQLTDSYFENGIAWFANLIYSAITFAVASGDCCPFVGHNALVRWSAIQDSAAYHDEADGREKYWSESHVSEDFDMAMRLQMAGWTLRYVAYTGTIPAAAEHDPAAKSFAEGLSLTVYDELARWEKYAYGCSELLFNPLRRWPTKGPFTRRFVSFVLSPNIRLPVKITVISYMGTYYAVAVAWIIALFNFFFMGFFSGLYRSFYLDAFAIYISLLFVFPFMGNVALAAHRYRLGQKSIVGALLENFKWVPMFTIFLGGIPIHMSQAIAAHLLGIDMTWGSTAKEVEEVGFVDEMARVLRRFRWSFLMVLTGVALILVCRFLLPTQWQITEFFAIFPLAMVLFCHAALPIVLNPALMSFSW
ncbi:hypothetical protein MGG_06886 [Pyricularia oryzae 70-15]|uniref:Uncharacterized protein n=1 Tax=Pyricularia oryzae (strain 70-15 / ATCC MYA-4617 / FGSC 8958) TaxID=242507 RepID=G4MMY2_PYRO7|nr:uncharacterized protein MGG_06886 [Pyricularia oryzae 70-15]EHA57004.1 hypothetical protein MGG_06886 [Pyricularia oryzae 70-15]